MFSDNDTAPTAAETYYDYDSDLDSDPAFEYPNSTSVNTFNAAQDAHVVQRSATQGSMPTGPLNKGNSAHENVMQDAHAVTRSATQGSMPIGPLTKGNSFKEIDVDKLRKLSTKWKAESLLVNPGFDEAGRDPTNMSTIEYYQQRDALTTELLKSQPESFGYQNLNGINVICKFVSSDDFRIVLTHEMLQNIVKWYHHVTVHATGAQTLLQTMNRLYYHPKLSTTISHVTSTCKTCKHNKKHSRQYGFLAARQAISSPWNEVHIDTIGPWSFKAATKTSPKTYKFYALTCIDPVTNLVELKRHDLNVSVPGDIDEQPAQPKGPTAKLSWKAFNEQ